MPSIPTCVRCPVVFCVAGEEFIAKKLRPGVYYLGLSRPYHRARFGTADEIGEDIAYAAEYGKLPQAGSRHW